MKMVRLSALRTGRLYPQENIRAINVKFGIGSFDVSEFSCLIFAANREIQNKQCKKKTGLCNTQNHRELALHWQFNAMTTAHFLVKQASHCQWVTY
jgi:hypothetical protein